MGNKNRNIQIRFVLGLIVLVIILCGIIISRAWSKPTHLYVVTPAGELNIKAVRTAIRETIRSKGGSNAYAQFTLDYATALDSIAHTAAHIFGEELYFSEGTSGIAVCDSQFGFGCYHSLFSKAIAQRGVGIVHDLDLACIAAHGAGGLGCQHGIGHGIGQYFGPDKIDIQLEICESLTWKGRFFGCQGGVFMEYNTPLINSGSSVITKTRPFDEKLPFSICPHVSDSKKPACYLELSLWWERVLNSDSKKMGLLCNSIDQTINRDACFLGIGYATIQLHTYSVESTIHACANMPDTDSELLCRAGASWSLFANPKFRNHSREICQFLDEPRTKECIDRSDLFSYK